MRIAGEPTVRLEPLREAWLDDVLRVEHRAYSHPWSRGNFVDSFEAGYHLQALRTADTLMGYWVAMEGVGEAHLLNLTVAPEFQGQGYALLMLEALSQWARGRQAQWVWLEVRQSNVRAMHVYERYGYRRVGERKNYYPADPGQREHGIVMSLKL